MTNLKVRLDKNFVRLIHESGTITLTHNEFEYFVLRTSLATVTTLIEHEIKGDLNDEEKDGKSE